MSKEFERLFNSLANQRIWMPAVVKDNGQVENITQAYVTTKGADKGETNYKTRKRPTKYGQFETKQGTFVANNHVKVQVLKTNEIDQDARIIRLGRNVRMTQVDGWSGIFAQAAKAASAHLEDVRRRKTEVNSEEI